MTTSRTSSDRELDALYALLMTRGRSRGRAPPTADAPLGFRPLMAAWNLLFSARGPLADDPAQIAEWNRGRHLVEGLGHCGGCHTPRNRLGAEDRRAPSTAAEAEGWYAPPLNARSPAVRPWTADAALRLSAHRPRRPTMPPPPARWATSPARCRRRPRTTCAPSPSMSPTLMARRRRRSRTVPSRAGWPTPRAAIREGATLFAGACAACHEPGAPMMQLGRPRSRSGTPLHEPTIRATRRHHPGGLDPPGRRGRADDAGLCRPLDDRQVAELAAYLRARFTQARPGPTCRPRSRRPARRATMITLTSTARPRGRRRSRHAAALRAAQRPGAQRRQVRLRPRPMRRLHRARRRQAGLLLPDAGRGAARAARSRTVEGLGTAGSPARCSRPSMTEQAAQCGYCIAGMIMRAQALLERNPRPTEAEIRAGMQPNLCRCGTHMRILRAVRRAAERCGGERRDAPEHEPCRRRRPRAAARLLGGGALVVGLRAAAAARPGAQAQRRSRRRPAGQPARQPLLDAWIRVDADGRDHRLHRQGRARPGHQDRPDPGRRGGAGRRRPTRIELVTADTARTPERGRIPPAATRCRTAAPRSATPRPMCACC